MVPRTSKVACIGGMWGVAVGRVTRRIMMSAAANACGRRTFPAHLAVLHIDVNVLVRICDALQSALNHQVLEHGLGEVERGGREGRVGPACAAECGSRMCSDQPLIDAAASA